MRKAAFIVIGILILLLTGGSALAMTSDNYNLPWSALSSGGGQRSSNHYYVNDMTGDLTAGGAESDHYILMSAFQVNASVTIYTPGDANGDDEIDISDMHKVARIILELDGPTPGADANQDGHINVFDMTKIARIILGLD